VFEENGLPTDPMLRLTRKAQAIGFRGAQSFCGGR
jgi:hypothetical protein